MTVEEAINKICPFKLTTIRDLHRNIHVYDCEADDCMMWRWFDPAIKNEGYCGLAGKEGAE